MSSRDEAAAERTRKLGVERELFKITEAAIENRTKLLRAEATLIEEKIAFQDKELRAACNRLCDAVRE